jgi:hypothetical protein
VALFPAGDRMNLSPALTFGTGGEYRTALNDSLTGFITGDARYSSKLISHNVVSGAAVVNESSKIWNATLRAGVEANHWTLTAFVENLTDEHGALEPGTLSNPEQARLRPRTVGLQFSFNY